ncbi:hypothetical protein ABGB17_29685, partial [Sphaerisporangium sp. B11E5]|uniref:hypothetical protein n=1 Tax=Sphaerisporangium sp. B11E5 TaxID=3153563 RepID=UPI00325DF3A4
DHPAPHIPSSPQDRPTSPDHPTFPDRPAPHDRTPLDDWTGSVESPPGSPADQAAKRRAARLFDIRRIIGGLFLAYGVILTVTGIVDTQDAVSKAEGIRVNLWTGIAMIVVAAVFIAWELLRPVDVPPPDQEPPA